MNVPWRPRNESAEDLQRETDAATVIHSIMNVDVTKLSEQIYGIDWAFFRNRKLVALAEYKHRAKRYDTLLLGLGKWAHGCHLAEVAQVPFIIFVQWGDEIYYYKATDQKFSIELQGNDRGQNGDKEPCVMIPTALFKKIDY